VRNVHCVAHRFFPVCPAIRGDQGHRIADDGLGAGPGATAAASTRQAVNRLKAVFCNSQPGKALEPVECHRSLSFDGP
jgi:hypothetical protein